MYRHLLLAPHSILTALSTTLMMTVANAAACAQEIYYSEDNEARRWTLSASVGFTSPFGPDTYSAMWNGKHSFAGSIEYSPDVRASFGAYASHSTFENTGRTELGPAECMRGIVRTQTGVGLM